MGDVNDLQEHLKNLIDKSSIPWTYAILWECSSQRRLLRFKDGYHRGSGKGKPKQVRIMGLYVSVMEDANDNDNDAASEWFFKISRSQYFEINEDLPGHAFIAPTAVWVNAQDRDGVGKYKWGTWERTKWAHNYGIRTFLCLRLQQNMVLELASTQIIPYDVQWTLHNVNLIHRFGTLTLPQQQLFLSLQQQLLLHHNAEQQQILCRIDEQQLLKHRDDADELNEEAVNEMKNRGKEKISDSKCSWTILTQSSDRGTDRTFSCSHDYSGPS